jgi:4'-phosphopantetheinyl transferase
MSHDIRVELRECLDAPEKCTVPDLPPDVVHVWIRPLQVPLAVELAHYELLSPEELQRAARFRTGSPRLDFILTRGTLRSLAGPYLGIEPQHVSFRYSEYGKPLLEGAFDLRFNVSHTDGLALVAFVRTRDIGVDVEKIKAATDARKLAERFFSDRECSFLENLSGEELHAAFFRCWTRKEAYLKARGEGLSLPLHQFDVSVAEDEPQALLATRPDPTEADRWLLRDLPASPAYAAALAVAETVGA